VEDVDKGINILLKESNIHFDNLLTKLKKHNKTFYKIAHEIVEYDPNDEEQSWLKQYGLIKDHDDIAVVSNKIYKKRFLKSKKLQDKMIPCNCSLCANSQEPHLYKLKDLKERIKKGKFEIECYKSFETVNVLELIDETHLPEKPREKSSSKNTIFISYSHNDEIWKDKLIKHLKVLQRQNMLNIWDDRQLKAGDQWFEKIKNALNEATVAVMMVSADFLDSNFILSEEVPVLLKKREREGLRIVPIIIKPCVWQAIGWLSKMQAVPKDGVPLMKYSEYEIEDSLANIAMDIAKCIKK